MKRIGFLLALLAVGAGLSWWFAQRPGAAADARPAASAQRAVAAAPSPAAEPRTAAAANAERASAPEPVAAPPEVPAAAPAEHHQPVQVVLAEGGAPVAGARIQWATAAEHGAAWQRDRDSAFAAAALESGRVVVADAEGRARLPRPDDRTYYAVLHEGLYAEGVLDGFELDFARIELAPDWDLAVEVVDAAGAPVAGAQVELRNGPRDTGQRRWSGMTRGEPPRAVLRHAPALVRRSGAQDALFAGLSAPLPAGVDPSVRVPLDGPPAEPLRLQLPQTGSLELRLVDERGQLVREGATVRLQRIDPASSDANLRGSSHAVHQTTVFVSEGVLELPYVGLELELQVDVWPRGERQFVVDRIAGPRLAGEHVTRSIELAETWPILVGRFLDEGGEALPSLEFSAVLANRVPGASSGGSVHSSFTCEPDGRFRIPMSTIQGGATEGSAEFRTTIDGVPCEVAVRFEALAGPGLLDLGDLVVAPAPRIVSGFVRDTRGVPLSGARITLERDQVRTYGDRQQRSWRRELQFRTQCAPDGSFAMHGTLPAGALRLLVEREGYARPEPTEFERGATDVAIVLQGAATVTGNLLLPEGAPTWPFAVLASGGGDVDAAGFYAKRQPGADGSFAFEDVPYGPWDFEVLLQDDAEPLLVLPGVVVDPGTGAATPALADIDLRGLVWGFEIEVVDPRGERVTEGWVRPLGEQEDSRRGALPAQSLSAGAASFWSRRAPRDYHVHVPGYRDVVLEQVVGDQRVELRDAAQVRIELPASVELPPSPHELRVLLLERGAHPSAAGFPIQHEGRSVGHFFGGRFLLGAAFDAARAVAISIPRSGRYSVRFVLATLDDDGEESHHNVPHGGELVLEIGDDDALRTVAAEPDREAYAAWLQALGGR